jgi:hypothetical protein
MEKPKTQILVCGDVEGKFEQLYQRVDEIQKKQKFDLLLCVGKFFDNAQSLELYKTGAKSATILTYFILTEEEVSLLPTEIQKGGQLCFNMHYLGPMGVKEIQGISVAFFSPTTTENMSQNTKEEMETFYGKFALKSYKGVDILLTNQWSKGILSNIPDTSIAISGLSMLEHDNIGDDLITNTINISMPRYHFATCLKKNVFYERAPYKNKGSHVTRFFSLASAFNVQKRKFLYAFALHALHSIPAPELYAVPSNATENPFKALVDDNEQQRFFKKQKIDDCRGDASFVGDANKARPSYAMASNTKKYVSTAGRKNECWFCMVSSVFEMHSIIKVGKHFYIAIAKGAINENHMLLVPIQHLPSTLALSKPAMQEMLLWKTAFISFFESKNENVVFCEHNQPGHNPDLQHLIYQVVGVPKNVTMKPYFESYAGKEGLEWVNSIVDSDQTNVQQQLRSIAGNSSYVWAHIPDENCHLIGAIEKEKFPFSFARRTIVNAIGHPELEDWKRCVLATSAEEKAAKTLRDDFEKFCEDLNKSI